jgi:hypothetical protein
MSALGYAARKNTVWPLTALQTLLGIITLVIAAVVALGQWNIMQQKSYKEAAEGGAALVNSLKGQLEDAIHQGAKERDLLTVQIQALQGQLALVQRDHEEDRHRTEGQIGRLQRLNHLLQLQLDQAELRSVKQTQQLQERIIDLPDRETPHERAAEPEDL